MNMIAVALDYDFLFKSISGRCGSYVLESTAKGTAVLLVTSSALAGRLPGRLLS
jgi:hypothetical protein